MTHTLNSLYINTRFIIYLFIFIEYFVSPPLSNYLLFFQISFKLKHIKKSKTYKKIFFHKNIEIQYI